MKTSTQKKRTGVTFQSGQIKQRIILDRSEKRKAFHLDSTDVKPVANVPLFCGFVVNAIGKGSEHACQR